MLSEVFSKISEILLGADMKIAVVATAHYLIRVMWSMLKNGTLWQERVQMQAA